MMQGMKEGWQRQAGKNKEIKVCTIHVAHSPLMIWGPPTGELALQRLLMMPPRVTQRISPRISLLPLCFNPDTDQKKSTEELQHTPPHHQCWPPQLPPCHRCPQQWPLPAPTTTMMIANATQWKWSNRMTRKQGAGQHKTAGPSPPSQLLVCTSYLLPPPTQLLMTTSSSTHNNNKGREPQQWPQCAPTSPTSSTATATAPHIDMPSPSSAICHHLPPLCPLPPHWSPCQWPQTPETQPCPCACPWWAKQGHCWQLSTQTTTMVGLSHC